MGKRRPRRPAPTYACVECDTEFTRPDHRGQSETRCEQCRSSIVAAFREAHEQGRLEGLAGLSRATGGALREEEIRCTPTGCVSCHGMFAYPCPFVDVDPGDVVIDLRDGVTPNVTVRDAADG